MLGDRLTVTLDGAVDGEGANGGSLDSMVSRLPDDLNAATQIARFLKWKKGHTYSLVCNLACQTTPLGEGLGEALLETGLVHKDAGMTAGDGARSGCNCLVAAP